MKIKSKHQGVITQNAGSEQVAGRNSFTSSPASEDHSLVYDWGIDFIQPHNSNFGGADHSHAALDTSVWFDLPMYHSVKALAFNVMNNKDTIEELELIQIDRVGSTGKGRVTSKSLFTNGIIVRMSTNQGDQRENATKGMGTIHLSLKFQQYQHECNLSNVTGNVNTTNAG
jgi:hypothetical protein